ncbi:MAG: helix-turn-helix domain-containing protein [Stellaceae bacterium]
MKNTELRRRTISVAQRGQIVQRVIVDGWTSAEVAAAFGVPRRLVEVWVTDIRRHGMSSLRQDSGRTIAAEMVRFTVWRPVRAMWRKVLIGLCGSLAPAPLVQPLPLRHSNKDGPR